MNRTFVAPTRRWVISVSLAAACIAAIDARLTARRDSPLDAVFAAYAAGDHTVVARTFTKPQDFQPLKLQSPKVLDEWLGKWQRQKAAFLIEVAAAANVVSPVKTYPILSAGRRYLATRPMAEDAAASVDEFERTWHRAALGLLQEYLLVTYEEEYMDALRLRIASFPALSDERLLLTSAIAQEQRCWNDRPDLDRAGAEIHELLRAAGHSSAASAEPPAIVAKARTRQQTCLMEAAGRFDAAFDRPEINAEARIRGAWVRFRLGQFQDSLRTIDRVDVSDDRDLSFWSALLRGRDNDALGRNADAERAYRAALTLAPNAQSAVVGLALTLFKLNRADDANAIALDARQTADPDPWWTYPSADVRFVPRWIGVLRGARQ